MQSMKCFCIYHLFSPQSIATKQIQFLTPHFVGNKAARLSTCLLSHGKYMTRSNSKGTIRIELIWLQSPIVLQKMTHLLMTKKNNMQEKFGNSALEIRRLRFCFCPPSKFSLLPCPGHGPSVDLSFYTCKQGGKTTLPSILLWYFTTRILRTKL